MQSITDKVSNASESALKALKETPGQIEKTFSPALDQATQAATDAMRRNSRRGDGRDRKKPQSRRSSQGASGRCKRGF